MCIQNVLCVLYGAWVYNGVLNVFYSIIHRWILGCTCVCDGLCIIVVFFTKILLFYSHRKNYSNYNKIITTINVILL
jgi:hypothetical protein